MNRGVYRMKLRAIKRGKAKKRRVGGAMPSEHQIRDDYSKTRSFHRETQADRLRDALDPAKAPSKVTRLKDMTPEQRAEMERLYKKP